MTTAGDIAAGSPSPFSIGPPPGAGGWEWVACNQLTTRVWQIPPSLGIDHRFVNGYLYISPKSIDDPDVLAARAEHFQRRAGHYYANWDEIYRECEGVTADAVGVL